MSAAFNLTLHRLPNEEGRRYKPYRDSHGLLTDGVGINLDAGFDDEEIDWLLQHRLGKVEKRMEQLPWYMGLDDIRKSVFLDLSFNMGVDTVLLFKGTIAAVEAKDWQAAHDHLLDSKWRKDVGDRRAIPLAEQLLTGVVHE